MMLAIPRLLAFLLASSALMLVAHGPSAANQAHGPIVSSGAVTTSNGSFVNVGQTVIGTSRNSEHGIKVGGIQVLRSLLEEQRLPDLDGDGDVDLDDHYIFALCMNGPEVNLPPRGCTQAQFDLADVEVDKDVDLADFQSVGIAFEIP